MKILKIMIVMLILIMSVGAVCAADAPGDDGVGEDNLDILETTQEDTVSADNSDTLEVTQEETYGEGDSFTDLAYEIYNATDTYVLNRDYIYDNETDSNNEGIPIDKDNFILDGNGHKVDGNNLSRIFIVRAQNVTINNITLVNGYADKGSAIYLDPGFSLTTNSVTYRDCISTGIGVVLISGNYTSNDDRLTNSVSGSFGVFNLFPNSNATFNNLYAENSGQLAWGVIAALDNCTLTVVNSTFTNINSKYSSAILGNKKTIIENCSFINLHANRTGGAIGLKGLDESLIKNCTFINVSSEKNGGAIFVDTNSGNSSKTVTVLDSSFENCYSDFGGAILQLAGTLVIDNCNFTNNSALYDGGAIYTSYTLITLSNLKFDGNSVKFDSDSRGSNGGTIYCDISMLNITNSVISNSAAKTGGALYLYDSYYYIVDNAFINNTNFNGDSDDIYTEFDKYIVLENNTFTDEAVSLNNTFYASIINSTGMEVNYMDNRIEVTTLPSRFDLRDWDWVTPVRDQGYMGSCWAFGTTGALESNILRYYGIDMDLSENNMQDVALQYFMYGTNGYNEGSLPTIAGAYILSWLGGLPGFYDTYDELGKISPIYATKDNLHIQDMIFIIPLVNSSESEINRLKEAIIEYGGFAVAYNAFQDAPYLNVETSAQYCDNPALSKAEHIVTLIGWDDHYSKDNFLIKPKQDGAWIIKNSWGEKEGIDGYYYVSYYDETFSKEEPAVAFVLNNTVQYTKNYQYDVGGALTFINSQQYSVGYVAIADDLITGIGTYFANEGVDYNIDVYINGHLRLSQNGTAPFSGFHTVKLDSYVPIKEGDMIAVEIKSDLTPVLTRSRQHYIPGSSQYLVDGEWVNASDNGMTCSIKVYTLADDTKVIENEDVTLDYGTESFFAVRVVTDDGHAVGAGEKVNFTINGRTVAATTDMDGIARLMITEVPGTYVVTTDYKDQTYQNNVTVVLNLSTCKVIGNRDIAVDYAGGKYFTVQVVSQDGKLAGAGAVVKFRIAGRNFYVTADENGTARLQMNLAPKIYLMTTSLNGKTYQNAVTVKHVLKTTAVTIKKTAKSFVLKATLKINGKAQANKKVSFIFRNHYYQVTTTKYGNAYLVVNKNVINSLKKGKSYAFAVTYAKDTIKSTVKVR